MGALQSLFNDADMGVGCGRCTLKKGCQSPEMKAFGQNRQGIMLIGEAPSEEDDMAGRPFAGNEGQLLQELLNFLGLDLEQDCYTTYAIKCKPDRDTKGKFKVSDTEIKSCRPKLLKEIRAVQPKLIILLGELACKVLLSNGKIQVLRGAVIPEKDVCNCWVAPVFAPHKILKEENWDLYIATLWQKDFVRAVSKLNEPLPEVDFSYTVATELGQIEQYIEKCYKRGLVVLDIENFPLKPFHNESQIVSAALCCEPDHAIVFDMERGKQDLFPKNWDDAQLEVLVSYLKEMCEDPNIIKIAHNLKHERLWFRKRFGIEIVRPIECTMLRSYMLDERVETTGLKFRVWSKYGIKYEEEAHKYINDMRRCPPELLYEYNANDTIFEYLEYMDQEKELRRPSQKKIRSFYYDKFLGMHDATVESEYAGAILDLDKLGELDDEYKKILEEVESKIDHIKEVQLYKQQIPDFSITSSKQVASFLYDFCKLTAPRINTATNNRSVDDEALTVLNTPFTILLSDHRTYTKLKGTYIDGLKAVLHDDGLFHTNYNLHVTVTGRYSSDDPNLQNIPKREHPEIRALFTAPPGHVLLSNDFSQWEVRVVQMYAKDPALGKAIWEGIDFHSTYCTKLFLVEKDNEKFKHYRGRTKNEFVFPTIYGAGSRGISKAMEISEDVIKEAQRDFFEEYHYLKEWQQKTVQDYQKNGYVETLLGRRRRAPMPYTKIVNAPVQSLASDFTGMAHERCVKLVEKKIIPPLIVHDDLTIYAPEHEWVDYYYIMQGIMTKNWDFDFINVPMEIESKVGYNWWEQFDVEKILKEIKEGV